MTIQGIPFALVGSTDSFVMEFSTTDGSLTGGMRIGGNSDDYGAGEGPLVFGRFCANSMYRITVVSYRSLTYASRLC